MWENVTPTRREQQTAGYREPPGKPAAADAQKRSQKSEENLLLFAQILLCALMLAGVFALRALQWPGYAELRVSYRQAMSAAGQGWLGDERHFIRFAQESFGSLQQAAKQAFAGLSAETTLHAAEPWGASTAETAARPLHGEPPKPPAGSSLEAYRPDFSLTAPLAGALRLTSGYGWRENPLADGQQDFHTGIDLAAAQGTPVRAAAAGVVRRAAFQKSYGNYLRVLHTGGDETLYAHMQYLFVRPGQTVRQGELLGTVGRTGDATGPHLHFELLHGGKRHDPRPSLAL